MKLRHVIDQAHNFKPKQGWAVFIDRDGTLNHERHLVHKKEDFILFAGSGRAIKLLNDSGIPVVLVHNASAISRGLCSPNDLSIIHNNMKSDLKRDGAQLDIILYCPHRPDAYNKAYAKVCDWQKPGTGMLKFVEKKYGINLSQSFVIGDSTRDTLAAKRAGAISITVRTGLGGKDEKHKVKSTYQSKNLESAVKLILKYTK